MSERPVLYLIDGYAVAYRQFYALSESAFGTSKGEITNAVFGFTRIVVDILLDKRPKYLAVAFDMGLSGRESYYPEYKAQRPDAPESLPAQIKRIEEVLDAFNVPVLKIDGYEADDIIGTISQEAETQGVDVLVVTGDRDILQLLSEHTRVQLPAFKGKPDVIYDIAAFVEKYGLQPNQLVDLKALMGDTSDNIPGVKGIGEKTATKLLQDYGTLDNIYAHLDEIKGAMQTKLREGKESAYLSQRLARIICDLDIKLHLANCVTQDFDYNKVEEIFRDLEFRSFFDKLEQYNPKRAPAPVQTDGVRQLSLFGETELAPEVMGETAPTELFETVIVQDKKALDELVAKLNRASAIVWDVETTSVDQMQAKLVGIALSIAEEVQDEENPTRSIGYYIPVGHQSESPQIALDFVLAALEAPLTNPSIPKYAHNASYDFVVMERYGIAVSPIGFDTMIAEWVRDPISKFLGLKNFARQYLDFHMTNIDELIGSGKKQRTMDAVPIEHAAVYAAADAVITMKAARYLQTELQKESVTAGKYSPLELLEKVEFPLIPVISQMEQNGVLLDLPYLREMSKRLQEMIADLEDKIYALGGVGRFNINSPKQINEVLFDKLKLSVEGLRKTSHGFSTDVNTLDNLKSAHPIVELILEHRELSKLKGTYVDAFPELVHPQTGRVHTSYNQTGTSTGRFSSSNPNLQNIPIRTEIGREVRRAFIVPEGYTMLAVDYSQIELRVMAHISQDKTLIAAFEEGLDIHKATAAAVYGIDPSEVNSEQRGFAKRVNFGLMYGMGAFRLARDSDLTLAESDAFIKTYFERLPGVERYIRETKAFVHEHGYAETLLGRRRTFPALKAGKVSKQVIAAEERAAINMPIQGTAADILKIAMIRLHEALEAGQTGAKMILQVHDELVLEVPENQIETVTRLVVDTMENAYQLDVPLVANAEIGQNWRDMQEL